jgi:hypothetical protein
MAYATRKNVYATGLAPAAFVRAPRTVEAVDAATDTFTIRGHGLETDRAMTFAIQGSPTPVLNTTGSALPTGLSASTVYYSIKLSEDLFKVALTAGGVAVAITDVGTGVFGVVVDFGADLDEQLEADAGDIDIACAAHGTPFPPDANGEYPSWLVALNARLSGVGQLLVHGLQNPIYEASMKRNFDRVEIDRADMAWWKKGAPIPGMSARDATPAVAEAGAVSWKLADRGWSNAANNGDLT